MILERYLMRRVAGSFLMVSGIFLSMLLLLDMVEQMRRLAGQSVSFGQVLRLSALNLPEGFYEIAPLVLMLAAMWVGLGWSRTSEFVVIRATGKSVPRLVVVPALAVLVASMGFVAVMNPLVAGASREYSRALAVMQDQPGTVATISTQGLWLRQADAQGQTVIHAMTAEATGTILQNATFLVFHGTDGVTRRLHAERAVLRPGLWQLDRVKLWDLSAPNPEHAAEFRDRLDVPTDLTPEQIRDSFAQVRAIPLQQLPAFIATLERAGFSALEHRMRLNMELALPVMLTGLMLLALALSIHHMRAGSAGVRALITILAGFALFFLRNFAQVLGESGQIPVSLAAWGLPVATLLMAIGVMLNLEEG
ncbi:lipopolysaccharide export system permease protein [Roseinatronobacter thiooxidans]|uniref:Lipopolysaccharide export system permease protein n=1 Tax=Roseinatronobacter thiooxidans TaxID=121821 RepID=A0A2W7QW71_9RHOB|nr:LPS export ABC transporter permease LptG [Roseinatronobacter thiooxidans]PZX47917.1 lipopolysaccharide export system permease protein [Roseinatronobacter thiooxidans]